VDILFFHQPFECDVCGLIFLLRSNLKAHIPRAHHPINNYNLMILKLQKQFDCLLCDNSYAKEQIDMRKSVKICGEIPDSFEFRESQTFFYWIIQLTRMRRLSALKGCPIEKSIIGSNYLFHIKDWQDSHAVVKKKKPFECEICDQTFILDLISKIEKILNQKIVWYQIQVPKHKRQ
jgi:transcription elongation factor Elf1